MPVDNYVEGDGSLLAEKEKDEKAKQTQKKVKGRGERRPSRREQRLGQWKIS